MAAGKKSQAAKYGSPTIAGKVTAKGTQRAGKSKASTAARKLQNAEVKDGTIRLGKNGKSYNVYDAKTGTWKRGIVTTSSSGGSGTNQGKKYTPPKVTGKPQLGGKGAPFRESYFAPRRPPLQ